MTGPEGDRHFGWWRIDVLEGPRHIEFANGFAGDDGEPVPGLPPAGGIVELERSGSGTRMLVRTKFLDVEQMERMLGMGMQEGMSLAHRPDRRAPARARGGLRQTTSARRCRTAGPAGPAALGPDLVAARLVLAQAQPVPGHACGPATAHRLEAARPRRAACARSARDRGSTRCAPTRQARTPTWAISAGAQCAENRRPCASQSAPICSSAVIPPQRVTSACTMSTASASSRRWVSSGLQVYSPAATAISIGARSRTCRRPARSSLETGSSK